MFFLLLVLFYIGLVCSVSQQASIARLFIQFVVVFNFLSTSTLSCSQISADVSGDGEANQMTQALEGAFDMLTQHMSE